MTSSTDAAAGGGCGGCGCLILLVVIGALLVMNPSAGDHKRAFDKHHPAISTGVGVMQTIGWADVCYHDCFLFSYVTCKVGDREVPMSAGILGYVYSGE